MPRKSKRPCRYQGCPKLVDNDSGYCNEHAKLVLRNYDRYLRSPRHDKRYGYRWRKLRTRFLNSHPFCEQCRQQGRYTLATEVHHVKPLADGGTNELSNLMSLCRSCHAKLHRSGRAPTPHSISVVEAVDTIHPPSQTKI